MAVSKKEPETKIVEVQTTEYILLKNVGSKKDGKPKKAAGSKVKLTVEQSIIYKSLNLI